MNVSDGAWACGRCGKDRETGGELGHAPWPGELGLRIRAEICNECWSEWMGVQTKIINEYRLNVLHPEHAQAVREQMEVFFGFREQDALETGTPS